MKKVSFLFIAYVFPPIPYAGTYRTMRLCNGLAERGHPVHVVSIRPGEGIHQDAKLADALHPNVRVHRTRTVDPWIAYRRNILPKRRFRLIRPVLGRVVDTISTPDHMVGWVPFAIKRGKQIIRDQGIDVVYTTSPPHSEQIVGRLLQKACGVPWIADLRDPITENTVYDHQKIPWRQRFVDVKLERSIIRSANAILLNTEHSRKVLEEKYPDCGRFHTLRNFFDPREFSCDQGPYPEFTLSHIGSIYAHRNPEILFQAYSTFLRSEEVDSARVRVKFVGMNDRRVQDLIEKYELGDTVSVTGLVSHQEALEIMSRSHLLLVIKGFGEKGLGQIPGKIYEYIGSGNSILCIGPGQSECARVIQEVQAGYTVEDDVEGLVRILEDEYRRYNQGKQSGQKRDVDKRRDAFSVERAVDRFLEIAEPLSSFL